MSLHHGLPDEYHLTPLPEQEIIDEDDVELLEAELSAIEEEARRRRWVTDAPLWCEERLGSMLWSKQREIMNSVRTYRKTAVASCHGVGKSYTAGSTVGWWMDSNPPGDAFAVTSAPTAPQVKAILWREIGRVHQLLVAKIGDAAGRVNQSEWHLPVGSREELVAFGRKPADYNPTAFQGIHAVKVLVVFDEACGIPSNLWDAADSLCSNDESRMLVIGNPDDPTTEFKRVCSPGSGWNVIHISAFDTPNFTGEPLPQRALKQLVGPLYVEEKRRKWAPKWKWNEDKTLVLPPEGVDPRSCANPLWYSKVLGQFPEQSGADNLIPMSWIRAAQHRELEPTGPNELGVDVGGGGDSSTIGHRRGPVFRIVHEDRNPDTMQTLGNVVRWVKETRATQAKVDEIGIGRGIRDRAAESDIRATLGGSQIVGINVSERPFDPEGFINLRAELYWNLRERFESGQIDIDELDDDLAAELVELKYKRTSSGKIQIEAKDEMKRRGIPSPNRAEAMMLAFGQYRNAGDHGITI